MRWGIGRRAHCGSQLRFYLPCLWVELPVGRSSLYDPEITRIIEPTQRWVLASPVLRLNIETNRHDAERLPHGVIVF